MAVVLLQAASLLPADTSVEPVTAAVGPATTFLPPDSCVDPPHLAGELVLRRRLEAELVRLAGIGPVATQPAERCPAIRRCCPQGHPGTGVPVSPVRYGSPRR